MRKHSQSEPLSVALTSPLSPITSVLLPCSCKLLIPCILGVQPESSFALLTQVDCHLKGSGWHTRLPTSSPTGCNHLCWCLAHKFALCAPILHNGTDSSLISNRYNGSIASRIDWPSLLVSRKIIFVCISSDLQNVRCQRRRTLFPGLRISSISK
jgi:hypothetical protein